MTAMARRVGRDALLYGLATILARVASVALLPVYTRYLTPADYGLLQLLELAAEVASILFVAGSRAGMMRFFYRTDDPDERNTVVSTTFFLETGLAVIASLALLVAAHTVVRVMLAGEGSVTLVRLSALNFLLGTLQNTPLTYLQTRQRAAAYTKLLTGKLVLQVAFNLFFLVHLRRGVEGMLLSAIIVNGLVSVASVGWLLAQTGARISWPIVRDLRRFGVPYQVTSAGGFLLTFGDRFFLQRYQGATQVGLYALAYQFGFLLVQVGAGPFLRAWIPERYKSHELPREERDAQTRQGFLLLNLLLLPMATGIALASRPAIRILTEPSYHAAAALVPLILLAYVLHSWTEAVKFGIDVAERTIFYSYASVAATVVVVIGYATLIPAFGAIGAVMATIVAFAVRLVLTYHWAQRFDPADYGWARVGPMVMLATGFVGVELLVVPASLLRDMFLSSALMTAYAASVWRLVLQEGERATVLGLAKQRLARILPYTSASGRG